MSHYYDVAGGSDQVALNTVALSVYTGVYPKVFTGTIPVGQLNLKNIDYDIQTAPTFNLAPSEALRALKGARLQSVVAPSDLVAATDESSRATFTLIFSKVAIQLNYDDGKHTNVIGSLTGDGEVRVNADSSLSMQVLAGTINIPNDDTLTEILNNTAVPELIKYLNQQIFTPITIPPLTFMGVSLTPPVVVTQNSTLLGFASLQPFKVSIPPAGKWPSGKVFVGSDVTVLNAVANAFLATENLKGTWKWSENIGICNLGVNASYNIGIKNARLQIKPDSSNNVTGTVDLFVSANFSSSCGFLSASFSATATATPTVTAAISVQGSRVVITFKSVDDIKFKFEFSGVPSWITDVLSDLTDAFGAMLASVVSATLRGLTVPVYQIPPINFAIAGIPFEVELTDLVLSNIPAPYTDVLSTVTGLVDVSSPGSSTVAELSTNAPAAAVA